MADENKNELPEEKVESGWASPDEPAAAPETDAATSQQKDLSRPSAHEIYQQVAKNAKEELKRSTASLAISTLTVGGHSITASRPIGSGKGATSTSAPDSTQLGD